MKQRVAPSMSKMQILSTECYSVSSIMPMVFNSYVGSPPVLSNYNSVPTNIFGGWMFGSSCWSSLFAGTFSPHQIIKPGKDTVDLQCDIWWLGAYQKDYPGLDPYAGHSVGWAVQMAILDDSINYNQIFSVATPAIIYIIMKDTPEHPMGNPQVAAVDAQGNIDWQYDFPIEKIGEYGVEQDIAPLVRPHLKEQWAVGYETIKVAKPSNWPATMKYPLLPYQLYKTPIRMVLKKNNVLATDPLYSFKNFTGNNETASGVGFQIFRLNDATCDGVFQQGVFGTDDHPAEMEDAVNFMMDASADDLAPIFIGMELRIL